MPLELKYGNYEPYPPASQWNPSTLYSTVITPWPPLSDDSTSSQYYWHLYYKGEKINGGLCDNEEQARSTATQYKVSHQRQEFLAAYLWDEESCRWQPRKYFMQ